MIGGDQVTIRSRSIFNRGDAYDFKPFHNRPRQEGAIMVAQSNTFSTISVHELAKRCQQGTVRLIDVRTPAEFREVHSVFAENRPLDALHPEELVSDSEEPLYVMCRSGNRSTKACEALLKAGHKNVVNVDGGTAAWEAAGLPVERGKKTISLERQVRIAAGFLVLIGAVLGFFVHPYWIALSAFVGAGLMFAGITDTCGMAMVLARMPWNQVSGTKSNESSTGATRCCSG